MEVLEQLQEILKEEQWTRATLDNFNVQNLNKMIASIIKDEQEEQTIEICLEFLKNASKSVTALYLIGFLAYEQEDKTNTIYLQQLLEIFKENKKAGHIELLATKILEKEPSNVYALQTMLTLYTDLKKDKERVGILQKLIKVDIKNGQVAEKLAEYYEQHPTQDTKDSETEVSNKIRYYQLALRRYAKAQNVQKVELIWKKLSATHYNKINFFLNIANTVVDYNLDTGVGLLFNLLETLEHNELYDDAIFIIKRILTLDAGHPKIRERIIDLYKKKHHSHPELEMCLTNSLLENPKAPLEAAIRKFEKEILFHENGYVAHRTWGIGTIKKIDQESFIIDFDTKKEHKMSYSMALSSLTPLSDEHIWVLKKNNKITSFSSEEDIAYILLAILRSFSGKNLSIDDFKDELVPSIISIKSWNNWWNKAKEILKEQPFIGTIKEGRPKYFIRSINIRFEEELIEKFHQSKQFDEKFKIFEKFKKDINNLDEYADEFKEMIAYFESILSNTRYEFNDRVISYILLKKIEKTEPWALEGEFIDIEELMDEDLLFHFLTQNQRVEYKKELIQIIVQYHSNYLALLQDILFQDHAQVADFLMEQLEKSLNVAEIRVILEQGVNNIFRENPRMTIWFLQYLLTKNHYEQYNFDLDLLYIEVLYRIDTLGKLATQKKLNWFKPALYTTELKKILAQTNDILFVHGDFVSYITNHESLEYIEKIYHLIKSSLGLIPKKKLEIMKLILSKNKLIDESSNLELKTVEIDYLSENRIWTTQEGLEKQQKRLSDLQKERSENLIDLEKAREKGDLRENAEYQAAREKDSLLNAGITELGEQIHKAEILDLEGITGDTVIPGTTVNIERNKKKETYTILGFWDTNEEKNIIAYNSPLAHAIMGLSKKDKTSVEIGGQSTDIAILDITPYTK